MSRWDQSGKPPRLTGWMCDTLRRWPPSRLVGQAPVTRATLRGLVRRGLVDRMRGHVDKWRLTDLGATVAAALRLVHSRGVSDGRVRQRMGFSEPHPSGMTAAERRRATTVAA